MGRAYTLEEKKQIKENLKKFAKEIFKEKGVKKARIEEITKAVGISLGGFYTFYKNKEELFLDIINDIEKEMFKKVIQEAKTTEDSIEEYFRKVTYIMCEKMNKNKIFIDKDSDVLKIINNSSEEDKKRALEEDLFVIERIKSIWRERGCNIDTPAEKLLGVFRCITTIRSNSDMIGENVIDELTVHIIDKFVEVYITENR
ncbi:TetR/AcrR family transcriptional regulator [Clostridium scatologenes]|uniref:TetR family transcriptional regulator n=1 Tax=Clostridium scatologenes TaxID=1548 RepID=A0A0E3JXE6_CLOSL|nr:TetR/AcrR family transcriptional regulator [Clostridium scatologenes]AKA68074.1 TetR family transcriptional regulator [Clostridium scatologenes]